MERNGFKLCDMYVAILAKLLVVAADVTAKFGAEGSEEEEEDFSTQKKPSENDRIKNEL